MGYTRYWNRTEQPITQEFVDDVNKIITDVKKKGITICGWNGTGEPEVTLEKISFNGLAPYMDCETCRFTNYEGHRGFDFCKTNCKPYDYVVKRVLMSAKRLGIIDKSSSDGANKMMSDAEWLECNGYGTTTLE